MSEEFISLERKKELEIELEELKTNKRQEILAALKFAKDLGDLSENAEYHQAREDQAKLEDRIRKIEEIIKESKIMSSNTKSKDIVNVGGKVVVQKSGSKDKIEYTIVGAEDANMAEGKISYHSPLGSGLLNKKKGDVFVIKTPKGEIEYKITDII